MLMVLWLLLWSRLECLALVQKSQPCSLETPKQCFELVVLLSLLRVVVTVRVMVMMVMVSIRRTDRFLSREEE